MLRCRKLALVLLKKFYARNKGELFYKHNNFNRIEVSQAVEAASEIGPGMDRRVVAKAVRTFEAKSLTLMIAEGNSQRFDQVFDRKIVSQMVKFGGTESIGHNFLLSE